MTYEAFKRELYRHVFKMAAVRGRHVRLLEKDSACMDEQVLRAVRLMSLSAKGLEDGVIREDILCIIWESAGHMGLLHWKIRPLYESFKREGWQSVLPAIVMKLQRTCTDDGDIFRTEKYGPGSDRLIIRPLNFEHNKEELENCIYWRFGEIALVLYAVIYDMDRDFMTMKITRGMLDGWGISDAEVLTNALLNTYAKMPPRLFHGTDLRTEYGPSDGCFMTDEEGGTQIHAEDETEGLCGYRLTTSRWLNGAVALFYPGVKERLAQMFDGDYYVGFTSIHEAVLHPVQHKILGEMKAAIQHTNAVFDQREMLTNCVYRYCRARNELVEV